MTDKPLGEYHAFILLSLIYCWFSHWREGVKSSDNWCRNQVGIWLVSEAGDGHSRWCQDVAFAKRMEKVVRILCAEEWKPRSYWKLTTMALTRLKGWKRSITCCAAGGIADSSRCSCWLYVREQKQFQWELALWLLRGIKCSSRIIKIWFWARDDTTISAQHFGHAVALLKNKRQNFESWKTFNKKNQVRIRKSWCRCLNKCSCPWRCWGMVRSCPGQIAGLVQQKEETVEEFWKMFALWCCWKNSAKLTLSRMAWNND